MLSIISTALNAFAVNIVMMRRCHAPIAACTAGREITPDTSTTVVKMVNTMTRSKVELADNAPNRAILLPRAQVRTLTIRHLQYNKEDLRSSQRTFKLSGVIPVGNGLTPALSHIRDSSQPTYTQDSQQFTARVRSRTQQDSQRPTVPVARRIDHTMLILATSYGRTTMIVVDTAAQISMISQSLLNSLSHSITKPPAQ